MADNLYKPSGLFEEMQKRDLTPSYGDFSVTGASGMYIPGVNVLFAPKDFAGTGTTLPHEVAHAYVSNVLQPAYMELGNKKSRNWSKEEKQFADAAMKLFPDLFPSFFFNPKERKEDFEKSKAALVGDRKVEDARYRLSQDELIGFGVGESSVPYVDRPGKIDYNVGGHLNPTMASQLSILTELYNKLPEELKQKAAEKRKASIGDYKEEKRLSKVKDEVSDVFENPFKNTLLDKMLKD
jgi:hypothetical protein